MPVAREDIRESSPAKTAAQMIRASRQALAPGSSAFDPESKVEIL